VIAWLCEAKRVEGDGCRGHWTEITLIKRLKNKYIVESNSKRLKNDYNSKRRPQSY
jgi:hypothetical protein